MTNSLMIEGTVTDVQTDLFGVTGFTIDCDGVIVNVVCNDYAKVQASKRVEKGKVIQLLGQLKDKYVYAEAVYFHWGEE